MKTSAAAPGRGLRAVRCVVALGRANLSCPTDEGVVLMKVDAEGAGLDESRLEWIADHLRSRYIEPGKIAGAQVAVVRGGVIGYFESFGEQDRERAVPVAEDAIWRL